MHPSSAKRLRHGSGELPARARYQFPAPVHDVKAAIRFLRANAERFGIDPDRIGVTGWSAGAYLALFLGLTGGVPELEGAGPFPEQSSRVACVVNHNGPVDLARLYGKSLHASDELPPFLGGDLTQARRNHMEASPINWVTPSAAPVLTIHGANDRDVPHEQAVWLTDRMRAAGAEAELETIGGEGADQAEARMFKFFAKHLEPAKERELLIADHGPGKEVLAVSWPSGKVLWRSANMGGRDVQALPNGHVLYTMDTGQRVVEIDGQRQVVWTYGATQGLGLPVAAQHVRRQHIDR